jgi:hypothetical protein
MVPVVVAVAPVTAAVAQVEAEAWAYWVKDQTVLAAQQSPAPPPLLRGVVAARVVRRELSEDLPRVLDLAEVTVEVAVLLK